jgi:hypothetical protein
VSEVAEPAGMALSNDSDDKEMCPFCTDKSLDDCPMKGRPDETKKVVSDPSALNPGPLSVPHTPDSTYEYTMARHHLISAKQCYAKLKRCVRMGQMAGYDINSKPNGIGLPTISNDLRFKVGTSSSKKYGDLSDPQKQTVSFYVMDRTKAQWHVGHHRVLIQYPAHWADELEDNQWAMGHETSYDTSVIDELLNLLAEYQPTKPCEKEQADGFKAKMDALSTKIKTHLNAFATPNPKASKPYFVSQLAARFANGGKPMVAEGALNDSDLDGD